MPNHEESFDGDCTSSFCFSGFDIVGSHLQVPVIGLIHEGTAKGIVESIQQSQTYITSLTLHVPYYRDASYNSSSLICNIRGVLGPFLQSSKTISKLILDGTKELEEASLDWRDAKEADEISGVILELAARIPSLRVLQLENAAMGASEALGSFFADCHSLDSISVFRKWPITLQCALNLSRGLELNHSIKCVQLCTTYSEYDCWHLDTLLCGFTRHPSLKCLSIETSRPTNACYRSFQDMLSGNSVLDSLKLQINLCRRDDKGESFVPLLLALNKANSGLKRLELTGCLPSTPAVTIALLCALQNSNLEELKLRLQSIKSEQASSLALGVSRSTTIKVFKVSMSTVLRDNFALDCASLETLLKDNTHVKELDLSHCGIIDEEEALSLGAALSRNQSLRTLSLSGNHLRVEAATILTEVVLPNRSLMTLNISNCGLKGIEGGRAVKALLEWKGALTRLNVEENNIGPNGASLVSEGLARNETLQYLSLESCGLESKGCNSIFSGLQFHRAIRCLKVRFNGQKGGPTSSIKPMLESQSCALRALWISGHNVTHVCQALSLNNTLRILRLEDDSFSLDNQTLMQIAQSLVCNSTLHRLDLGRPNSTFEFDSGGVQQFLSFLPHMKGLKCIYGLNRFKGIDSHSLTDMLSAVLRENKILRDIGEFSKMAGSSHSIVWFFLQSNQHGRKFLHSNSVRHSMWPFVLAKMATSTNPVDTGCLFHFLTNKPDLVCLPDDRVNQKRNVAPFGPSRKRKLDT